MTINLDPEEIYRRVTVVGLEWARKDTLAGLAENNYKQILNAVIQEKLANGTAKSFADADSKAKCDKRVVRAAKRKTISRGRANKAKAIYDGADKWFEARRTQAATLRQEMKMAGSHQ